VAGKYQDVLTLEQSVAELHQMFLDFALLTEQQGELLDQIEFQVKQAGDYVEEANVDVHQAIEYQKSIRKKQWCVAHNDMIFCFILAMRHGSITSPPFFPSFAAGSLSLSLLPSWSYCLRLVSLASRNIELKNELRYLN
jgi:predicted ferric reductase